jgi:cation transport ATPase
MKIYKLKGMDCANCAAMLESDLNDAGIKCKCSYSKSSLEVEGKHDFDKLIEIAKKSSCSVLPD